MVPFVKLIRMLFLQAIYNLTEKATLTYTDLMLLSMKEF